MDVVAESDGAGGGAGGCEERGGPHQVGTHGPHVMGRGIPGRVVIGQRGERGGVGQAGALGERHLRRGEG
eukprot:scaffold65203_cov15-Phaeocystis_antarctica.AAC.1